MTYPAFDHPDSTKEYKAVAARIAPLTDNNHHVEAWTVLAEFLFKDEPDYEDCKQIERDLEEIRRERDRKGGIDETMNEE